jgi:hypothetical protein
MRTAAWSEKLAARAQSGVGIEEWRAEGSPRRRSATPAQTGEVHTFLRALVAKMVDVVTADSLRIQYGGSVSAANAVESLAVLGIDGALVGGASLKIESFRTILDARGAESAARRAASSSRVHIARRDPLRVEAAPRQTGLHPADGGPFGNLFSPGRQDHGSSGDRSYVPAFHPGRL